MSVKGKLNNSRHNNKNQSYPEHCSYGSSRNSDDVNINNSLYLKEFSMS